MALERARQRMVAPLVVLTLSGLVFSAQNDGSPRVTGASQTPPSLSGQSVQFAPSTGLSIQIELAKTPEGEEVVTLIGGLYIWSRVRDERTGQTYLLELLAENAVVWLDLGASDLDPGAGLPSVGLQNVEAVYLSGNVVMTEGLHTVRADELYYDLSRSKGIARNTVLSTYDPSRDVPLYLRAATLKRSGLDRFEAEDVTLTTSEFHVPQVSVGASRIWIVDTRTPDQAGEVPAEGDFEATMEDVAFRYYDWDFLRLPRIWTRLERPDVPVRSVRLGHDGTWGTSFESRWYLGRLLGLRQPEGTRSSLALDYYGERGPGAGIEIDYARETYYGNLLGYVIYDSGEDLLGRHPSRRNLEPPSKDRGRFRFQHRQFLPHSWQLTAEVSDLSDENFLEQYYRREFNVEKEQETLIHLKRINDNWGVGITGKARINDFVDQVEEQPTGEFHWTGQSLPGDSLTFYSDSQASRFRYRFADGSPATGPTDFFNFATTRNELDLPLTVGESKIVPFVAGSFAYDDGGGFFTGIDGSTLASEDSVWIGEVGLRASGPAFWKVDSAVQSDFWDLDRLRHVFRPQVTAVTFAQSEAVAEQRDVLNLALLQRWQTKRGPKDDPRTVDWIRFDVDFTWVNDAADTTAAPDQFIWNKPFVPPAATTPGLVPPQAAGLVPLDRRSSTLFGPQRSYVGADVLWQLSDTTAVLADVYYDIHTGIVQQADIGFSRVRWPNLSYYVGSRYLRQIDNGFGEQGSNAFTFAAIYKLDPRYSLLVAQQYDLDYGENIRSDVTLIRRYHRMNLGLTFSADESLDRESVVLSMWPEGVPEMALGLSRYMGLGGVAGR